LKNRYLEVTFRHGKPLAAYLCLPRAVGVKSARTEEVTSGVLVDFSSTGVPIGLEIVAPATVTTDQVNTVLKQLGLETVTSEELAPLKAA
jgi:hypothetical protein